MKNKKILKRSVLSVLIIIILIFLATFLYLSVYSKNLSDLKELSDSHPEVTITDESDGIFIDSPGDSEMAVFYPGAKIDSAAYVPLLVKLAENGIDSYIIKMPFHMAFFNQDAFADVKERYSYDNWYLMGHSLGGAMAADYAAKNPDSVDGLILLAAYPTQDLSGKVPKLLSIYGDKDEVLNLKNYENGKAYWPQDSTELIIPGGNHAGFGDYGEQNGDGKAQISGDEQKEQTSSAINEFLKK